MNKLRLSHAQLKKIVRLIGVLSILFSLTFICYLVGKLDILNNPQALSQLIKDHLLIGSIVFFLVQIIQVVIPIIPGGITTVVGFLTFGPILGLFLNVVGIILGSSLLFILVRKFGKPFVLLFIDDEKMVVYEEKLASKIYERIFILNMISPVAPADVMIMITGLSKISFKKFLLIIILCRPISMVVYSYFWIHGGQLLSKLI
ncbi:TVP38/TMEM64 family protein [Streptococcus iniae]|uniref:TVP38/TMEM64 family protein n=1 Tax=Streptococcus iniae TaxID=1346 RepID=UPI000EF749B7|nr:VTT domain-containing protein [Streptococcus iniae]RLV18276.1 TVP38/TMEM64 family protein [Streptococcus iniae]